MKPDGDLILCTIIASAPEYGLAFLNTYGGTEASKGRLIGYLPYTDATCGAMAQSHFPDGSTVVCMLSRTDQNVAYILTAVNNIGADKTDTYNGRVFYNSLGHHDDVFNIPQAQEMMRRGMLWAAEGKEIFRKTKPDPEQYANTAKMY